MTTQALPALLRNVGDTALWSAAYRAHESAETSPLFVDPFACALAGEQGQRLVDLVAGMNPYSWIVPVRTYLLDNFIARAANAGIGRILNLAAGLDTRPYRMSLPRALEWIEVDSAEVFAYKQSVLGAAEPVCSLRQVVLDLADTQARDGLLDEVTRDDAPVLVISEGLLIYLKEEAVASLAETLSSRAAIRYWLIDLQSRTLQLALQRGLSVLMGEAGSWLSFAPRNGAEFFRPFGWQPLRSLSTTRAAHSAKRLPQTWSVNDSAETSAASLRRMDTFVHVLGNVRAQNVDSSIFSPATIDPTLP